ncbi:carboxymuconolactone decarboxylase family protein [Gluconacetobacter tumulisoli]|uniref:Carboxymuconolactone decarboxylase family protein n=1 Tax=Gluconacetobacter tumulisoli TaxID=1286189 RepID=A0A7W4K594_9PROT|nr:carboxymuconolactone decarboxylase family protein [Gluconacetobacter tumulisoli]MBB2200654.1 carboxymuconolactone decarboxylase family protein [Gluconacetobacter tumulisoli]
MTERLDYYATSPALLGKMLDLEHAIASSGLDRTLLELVKIRASQINGCAFCLDMHLRILQKAGERTDRIVLLDAWREAPIYTARERAALGWTEALTLVASTHAPDDAYEALAGHFTEQDIVQLTLAIAMINGWNRIVMGFRALPRAPRMPGN